jgi:hypothetical protein
VQLDEVLLVEESKWHGLQRVSCPDASQHFPGKSENVNYRIGHDYD